MATAERRSWDGGCVLSVLWLKCAYKVAWRWEEESGLHKSNRATNGKLVVCALHFNQLQRRQIRVGNKTQETEMKGFKEEHQTPLALPFQEMARGPARHLQILAQALERRRHKKPLGGMKDD